MKEAILRSIHDFENNWIYFYFNKRKKRAILHYFDKNEFNYEMDMPIGEGRRIYHTCLDNGYEVYK
jgi:hypothetical protein